MSTHQSDKDNYSVEIFFPPQVILGCVKLTVEANKDIGLQIKSCVQIQMHNCSRVSL